MRLHDEDIPLFAPGCCILCEQTHGRGRLVDTETNLDAGNIFKLNGRKYVCELCIKEGAGILGLPTEGEYAALSEALSASEDALDEARAELEELRGLYSAAISAAVERIETAISEKLADVSAG